ncbi:MAG: type II secretion system protein N [bacterium]
MKPQLWMLNSALLMMFVVAFVTGQFVQVQIPVFRPKTVSLDLEKKKEAVFPVSLEKIYKEDLFDTYVPEKVELVKKELVTPVPQPKPAEIVPVPELQKQSFIAPLTVIIKGIIISADENQNVAMIEDETKKEGLYHLGEKIKDAQIVKIARNRIVLLRGNGQQEIFYLRKDDLKDNSKPEERWKYIVKRIEDRTYQIDPDNFKDEIDGLGSFIERAAIIGTAYQTGKPIGLKVGLLDQGDIGGALGLQKNDILLSVNKLPTADLKSRLHIYDTIADGKIGDKFSLVVKRGGQDETLLYEFAKISKASQKIFTGGKPEEKKPEVFDQSRQQKREDMIRQFRQQHSSTEQKDAIARIRERLLNNLKMRMHDSRVR